MSLFANPDERRHTDRRGGLRKPVILIIGVLAGILCWTGQHYLMNAPLWLIRAAFADHDEIYAGKTNGVPNRDLVTTARNYITQVQEVEVNGQRRSLIDLDNVGLGFNPKWFLKHHPSNVDFNPFAPADEGHFVVTWVYVPGCQRTLHPVTLGPGENWFDLKGVPCYSTYTLSVHMSSDQRLTKIKVQPKTYI